MVVGDFVMNKEVESEPWAKDPAAGARRLPFVNGQRQPGYAPTRNMTEEGFNSKIPDALYGDTEPWEHVKHEKPVHRTMAEMAIAGHTAREIAKFTGYSEVMVGQVLKQP